MKTSELYDVDYFIGKFSKIPRSKWTTKSFEKEGKYCAIGHCGSFRLMGCDFHSDEGKALIELFKSEDLRVDKVNNGHDDSFPGKTPKGRILAALGMIKKMEKK